MSTLSGVSSKGEKGKSKFQSLDINSLYNKTNRGESSEPHTQKSTVPRKHGMQSLGKVPSARRPPANLPSLKSEHSGNDPTVSLVPTGGTGWGSKPGETGPSPTTQPPPQTTAASSINHSLGASAPAAVGTPAPQTNTISQPPTQGQVNVKQTGGSSSTSGGDKTWSSVMSGGETGPSFLAHQSPQFQQEFPSLSGEAAAPVPPVKGPIGQEGQYGPGPSLRPQTEGSWIQGGGTRAPPPVTTSNTTTSPPQHPFLPQESVSGGNRNNLGQFGSGTVPGGPPPQQPPQIPSQFKGVVPPFMLNRGGGFSNMFPPNFNNPPVRPRFHAPPENRFVQGSRPPPLADPEDLIPRPIIREEDLNRMDEISRDTGWATQDDIDYNQKLAFSDDESAGPEDNKDTAKDINNKSSSPSLAKDEKDLENEKEPNEKQNDRLSAPNDKQQPPQPWQGRGPPALPSSDFRGQISRTNPHPVPLNPRVVDAIEEHWKEKRRQVSEKVAAVTEKAKQRKEEEEKRFEESRSKSHLELEQKSKKGKEDVHGIEQHPGTANISEWEKDSMPAQQVRENKDAVENFRQMTQLDNRSNFNREKERDRDMRGERDVQTFQRFQSNLPPRFQKQMNDRPGNQQYMRQSPNNVTNSMQSFESRWTITNSHTTSHFSGKQTNNTGRRNDTEITDRDIDRDRMKENDDKDRRERLTPEESIERERREREELEWEGRRGNSSWDHNRHYDDKYQGRRDSKKSSNDAYSNKSHERENEWRDRPQRPESRERPDRPPRPDSRDSRASRDSRNSRESMRDESRAIPELMNNDYPWADIEYEKDIREEKPRKKENYKDEKRENLPRREGHVPGPITREKMEAYEHKQNLAKAEKKEVIGGNNNNNNSNVPNNGGDDDARNKLQSSSAPSVGGTNSNTVSWADSTEEAGSTPSNQTKDTEQQALQATRAHDDVNEKNVSSKDILGEKKKENVVKEKDKSSRGGRGGRGGNRTSGNYPAGSNYGSVFYRGSGSSWNSKESRRSSNKSGSQKQGQWNASESEASADEVSASTESGKEDKKTERKQIPRSPRPGERKRDKEERIRESKKNENDKNRQDKKQQSNVGQGSGYESGGGSRKEGFAPRGEPSRRGRGGYRTTRGNLGNVAGHYGPPGNKSPFPSHGQHDAKQEDDTQAQPSGSQPAAVSDLDSSTGDDKTKQKQQIHVQPPATGIRPNKDNINSRVGKNKSNNRKGGSGGEEWETTSEASDSESKNLKHSKIQQKMDKSKLQRPVGDKRGQFSTAHMNGRPSRSEDGKDNGFQEVRSKKVGKESRPLGKDEPKRGRGKEGKGKGLQGSNSSAKAVQSKSYTREWSNNKPPRLQRLENNRKQQHQQQQQEVSEMNKINQNVTALFPIRDVVTCSAGAPPPPPSVNAWDKPITATLRTTPPPANNPLHLASTISNSQDKSAIDLNEHGQSGASSQTSSPCAEKALTKMSRDAVEKALLDGTTPPVQTIIFENTNYKVPSEMAMKAKYSSLKGQRIDKARGKLEEDLDSSSHGIGLGGFKPGSEIKQGDNKPQEPIQISMSFSKNEDNADMKLDFAFDSDLSQLTEDKTNIPRSIHLGQTSAADLNQKIASVKKVWETAGAVMEHQHHVDENHGVVSTSSSFTPNFGSAVDTALDHSAAHQVDDSSFTNSDVYSAGPTIQANSGAYSSGGTNIIKQDPNSASTNVKPQPQQTTVMSSGIGTHSAPSLSSPPPAFTQQGHFNYQAQYSNMPAIPSPPAVLINSATGAQQVNHQGELFHSFPLGGPTVIGNQAAARSGFSQYAYSLSQGLGQTSAAAFSQQSLYHLPQPAAPPPPPNAPPDVFSSLSQYRIQPSAYGQSQQLSNNPSTVLITSSSNSLMSASVKSSPQPPIGAPIGTKGGYQSSAHPSQVQLGFIQYETQMLPQNFLQNSQLVQQRHGGSNVVPAIQPPTSYYSSSAGGQTGLFQPGSSILASTGNQPGLHSAATAFGMQGFGTQSAGNPAAAPSSTNPVGVPSFTTQMGHFRAPAPATYLKAGNPSGQHPDASKSPSNNQDVLSVFTTGGGQIPSPKSRATGAATGGGSGGGAGSATSGGTTKQVGPSPASQQPSPTQSHHKFSSYQSQQNLVLQQQAGSQSNRGGPQMTSGGVRNSASSTASGGGSASSGSLSANGVMRFPNPIQRPVDLHQFQQQQHQQQQQQQQQQMMQQVAVAAAAASAVTQPRHNRLSSSRQQHIKIANQYYPQQGNPVKLDGPGLVEGKTDTDKLQENNTSASKQDKGKEESSTNKEQ